MLITSLRIVSPQTELSIISKWLITAQSKTLVTRKNGLLECWYGKQ